MTEFVISTAVDLLDILLEEMPPPKDWEHQLLVDEKAAAVKGSEEHLQGLKTDLTSMLSFLKDFSGKRNHNHLTSQVREMANDSGVIIDTFIFTRSEELEPVHLNNFLRDIQSIRSRFRQVNLLSPVGVEEAAEDAGPELKHAPDNDHDVVGLEDDLQMVINDIILFGRESNCSLMIKGMAGIGKTTFAREIYNHAAVVERFECRGWACVSSEFRPEEILMVLIRDVVGLGEGEEIMKEMDVERLQQLLLLFLLGKRYLIVIDNVMDDTNHKYILAALPREDNSSRVMFTGRSSTLIENADYHYNMNHLSSDASWQLFVNTVFTVDHKCPKHLEQIGRKMVAKCNGLPLAIMEVGRQLATKQQTESEWEEFLESTDFRETTTVLESSFDSLSPELKSYFMHISFFRDGISHRGERAVHIWNAAGSVTRIGDEGVKMEDAARIYLHALANECMITAEDYTPQMLIKTFSIDGFLHKICITKAQEEIGFEILRNEEYCRPPCKSRHRAIYCTRDKFKYSTEDKHLLSLFFYGGGNLDASPSYWEYFEELRILDLEGFGLKSLPGTICALGRLRYLGLRDNHLQELPHTLCRLKNLEVLDIALNFMIELPNILWEMDSLRHLYMCDVICRSPLKIDSLKYLQTLTFISVNNWVYELSNLEKMTSLCKLGIEELDENSDVSKLFESLAKLENLKHLILRGLRFKSMPQLAGLSNLHGIIRLKVDGRLTKLPKFPPNIRYLNLVNSCLDDDPMPELEKIPSLYYLKLRNAYTGREMVISQHGLQDLELLHIIELKHLRNLRLGEYLTGLLEILEIWTCPYLDNIPEDMLRFGPWKIGKLSFVTTKKIAKLIQQSGITSRNPVLLLPSGGVRV